MKHRAIGVPIAALTLILMSAACDSSAPSRKSDPLPPQAAQRSPTAGGLEDTGSVVEPHRYLRLSDLAAALREAGYSCEAVRNYNQMEQNGKEAAVYKVDCLEYSYKLTIIDGRSRIDRWSPVIRE